MEQGFNMGSLRDFNLTKYGCDVYVETGTGMGGTLSKAFFDFKRCFSVDMDKDLVDRARAIFPTATIDLGLSIDILEKWLTSGQLKDTDRVLFFLDAHFPGSDYRNAPYDLNAPNAIPLEDELKLIKKYRPTCNDFIICDDARIYIEGPYENGAHQSLCTNSGLDFIQDIFPDRDVKLHYSEEGYILIENPNGATAVPQLAIPTYNRTYAQQQFIHHGENWIQQKIKGNANIIFDVGSNIGEWTYMARSIHPDAEIHTFEIIPNTYKKLLSNIVIDNKIIPNGFGLSDVAGTLKMKHRLDYDVVSTYLKDLAVENFQWRTGLVMTGDDYVESRQINYIDYLKIDTEGAEGLVLKGFKNTLEQQKVGIIQFEYSYNCILSRWMLIDAYELLTPLGYKLGRLTKDGIQFHEYALYHETFGAGLEHGAPDYIAVHHSKMHLFT